MWAASVAEMNHYINSNVILLFNVVRFCIILMFLTSKFKLPFAVEGSEKWCSAMTAVFSTVTKMLLETKNCKYSWSLETGGDERESQD